MKSKFIFYLIQVLILYFIIPSFCIAQETLSKEEQVQLYFNQAYDFKKAGENDKAIEYYTKVIDIDSSNGDAYWYRAEIYGEEGKFINAIDDFKKFSTIWPEYAEVYGKIGRFLLLLNRLDEALAPTEKAMKLDSTDFVWIINYGHIFLLKGDTRTARVYYEKSLLLIYTIEKFNKVIADFELFIENGWQVDACRQEMDWMKNQFELKIGTTVEKLNESLKQNTKDTELELQKHSQAILSVAISPDMKYIVTGSMDSTAKLWDIETGKCIKTFSGHSSSVNSVAFTPDGTYIITGSYDKSVKIWDIKLGKEVRTFSAEWLDAVSIEISHDGKYILTCDQFAELVKLWEIETGKEIVTFTEATSAAISTDGKHILIGYNDGTAELCDTKTGIVLKRLYGHSAWINSIAFSSDGKYVITGSGDNTAKLWDVEIGQVVKTFSGHSKQVILVTFSDDKKYILTSSGDPTVKLWDIKTGKELRTIDISAELVEFSPKGKYILTYGGSLDHNTAELWDTETGRQIRIFYGHSNSIESVAFSPDERYLLTGSWDKTAILWEVETGEVKKTFPDTWENLNEKFKYFYSQGNYEKAISFEQKALRLCEIEYGKSNQKFVRSMSNIGVLYSELGRYEDALPLFIEALKLTKNNLGKYNPEYSLYLNSLAALYYSMNRYEDALPLAVENLEILEKSWGKNSSEYCEVLNILAALYERLNRIDDALLLLQESIEIVKKFPAKYSSEYARYCGNLAAMYSNLYRFEEALPFYLEALDKTEDYLGKSHRYFTYISNSLASLYESIDQYTEALPLYLEANSNLHNQIKNIFSFSSENAKKDFFNTLSDNFKVYQSFHYKTSGLYSEIAEMLYDNQLILKGLLLTSSKNTLQAIRESGNEETKEIYNQWIGMKRQLAAEYSKPISEQISNIDSLEAEANKLEAQLVSLSKEFMTEKQKQEITWKDVQKRLGKDEVAMEFSSFRYYDKRWTDSTLYVAYVVTADSKYPEMVYLFEEKELNELIRQKTPNKLYTLRGTEKINETETDYTGVDLYGLVLKPLEKYLEGKERIYFSTDGILHQFSFAAFSTGGGELLCDKYELVRLNSTGVLALEEREPEKAPAVLVGGITYEYKADQTSKEEKEESYAYNILEDKSITESRSNRGRGMEWNYLPGTKTEIEKLAEIYTKNNISSNTLTGVYATEESIKKLDGNSPKVLHIATHGFFFENPEEKDKDRRMSSFDENQSYIISEDPLMRSGLILAGANYAWKNGSNSYEEEDGILTAYEISNLNLLKTDLVVLSACETGLGDIEGSEGVYGLQRAFRMAGVEKIIMSLWQVPDKETVEFMETFYGNWIRGHQIREAFNNTQRVMSKKYKEEPEKWAAFVLLE